MTQVKICGVCAAGDAAQAAAAGADYIGVILVPGRPRSRTEQQAGEIYGAARGAARVGVFVDPEPAVALGLADRLGLDVVQLHGNEGAELAAALRDAGRAVWKAVRVREAADVRRAVGKWDGVADALLLDGWSASGEGGVGATFSWSDVAPLRARWPPGLRLVVAGGLTPENVAAAVAALRPDVVDVSSGVEATLCVKSPDRVHAFMAAARGAAHGG
jgi:phosphoribosylanthranilate isomerase